MKVGDLVAMGDLQLTPLAGDDGLERVVRWVYTTDLLDPGRYLSGGEVVLTGMMWRRTPADSAAFVATAAANRVACIAAGEAAYGEIPADLVAACAEYDVPLLEVPVDVSFATITERIIRTLTVEQQGDLTEQLSRRRRMLAAVAEGAGLDELLRLWAQDAEIGCALLTATGRAPVPTGAVDEQRARELAARFLAAPRFPEVVRIGRGRQAATYSLFAVGDGPRVAGWFLACEGDHRTWPRPLDESVTELASLIALEWDRLAEARRADQVIVEQLVRLVRSGRADADEVARRLDDLGVGAARYVAVSATMDPRPDGQLTRDVVEELLATAVPGDQARLVTALDDEAIGLVDVSDTVPTDVVRAVAERLRPAFDHRRLVLGLSLAVRGPGELADAVEEARQAMRLAHLRAGRVAVLATDEIDSHGLLLAAVPDDVRRTFRSRVLGPVLDYDSRHGSDLAATLGAFLEESGSWTACAQRLHLHVNTLRYRIRRIEELTGRSLATLEDRVDFFLALRAG